MDLAEDDERRDIRAAVAAIAALDRGAYYVSRSVVVVDEVPRTSTVSVQKNIVRKRHTAHYGSEQ